MSNERTRLIAGATAPLAALLVGGLIAVAAQERIDQATCWKIRQEATTNSTSSRPFRS
jgi:hypothetical protein